MWFKQRSFSTECCIWYYSHLVFNVIIITLFSLSISRGHAYYCIRFHIFRHNRSSSHHSIVTDCHSWKNRRIRTYPDIPTQYNRCRIGSLAFFREQPWLSVAKTTLCPIWHPSPIITPPWSWKWQQALINTPSPTVIFFPEIGIERWEYPETMTGLR